MSNTLSDDGHAAHSNRISSTVDRTRPFSFPGTVTRTTAVIQTRTWGDQNGTGDLRPSDFNTSARTLPTYHLDHPDSVSSRSTAALTPSSNGSVTGGVSYAQAASKADSQKEKAASVTLKEAEYALALLGDKARELQTEIRKAQVAVGLKKEEEWLKDLKDAATAARGQTNTVVGRGGHVPSDPTVRNERSMNCE